MANTKGVRIAQIQSKDLFRDDFKLSNFNATFDYSLDLINLEKVYYKVYRNNKFTQTDENGKEYTRHLVSLKFDYVTDDMSKKELREYFYKNGFTIDGLHYVRWKRSSGSARVGKCLFVNQDLYSRLDKIDCCGLNIEDGQEIDLASFEAYISLTTSSIIDTLEIKPNQILIVDDIEKTFKSEVNAVDAVDDRLNCKADTIEITNNITDGESLIEKSALGIYQDKGMVLLRNQFFKSCCFNTNIQMWFNDNNITDITQLKGFTLAEKIEDIKLITTPSSIKYYKFGNVSKWLKTINSTFGICKHEKETHFDDGNKVQTHYQLLNSLQLSEDECKEFLKPSIEHFMEFYHTDKYAEYLKTLKYTPKEYHSSDDVVMHLVQHYPQVANTEYFKKHMDKIRKSYRNRLLEGHILINGNYSTLLSAPIELLQSAIKNSIIAYDGLKGQQIMSKRFDIDKMIMAIRSPHICAGNVLLAQNVNNETIDKYINLTNEIVVINANDNAVMDRLSGCDYDSDSVLLTDNEILLESAKRNYDKFLVPVASLNPNKIKRVYTCSEMASLDFDTSENLIGEIVNLSQKLNSIMWDKLNKDSEYDIKSIYDDICVLSVLSGIEIDKAKKQVDINVSRAIKDINKKYEIEGNPLFFKTIKKDRMLIDKNINSLRKSIKNKSDERESIDEKIESLKLKKEKINENYIKYDTSMDFIYTIVKSEVNAKKQKCKRIKRVLLSVALEGMKPENNSSSQYAIVKQLLKDLDAYDEDRARLFADYDFLGKEEKQEISNIYRDNKEQMVKKLSKYKDSKGIVYFLIKKSEEARKDRNYLKLNNFVLNTILTPNIIAK